MGSKNKSNKTKARDIFGLPAAHFGSDIHSEENLIEEMLNGIEKYSRVEDPDERIDKYMELVGGLPQRCTYRTNTNVPKESPYVTTEQLARQSKINIPLPWEPIYCNNRMYMMLNTNPYYVINVPTDFYVISDKNGDSSAEDLPLIDWKIDKPSYALLDNFIKEAVEAYYTFKSEFAAVIVYNINTDKHRIVYPHQNISGGSVSYNPDDLELDKDEVILIDLHSHHVMNIGFSSTDDHSDNLLGAISHISVILKGIQSFNFLNYDNNFDIRLTVQGNHYPLKLKDCFELFRTNLDYNKIVQRHAVNYVPAQQPMAHLTIGSDTHNLKEEK